jgi:predicted transcriptional regulator
LNKNDSKKGISMKLSELVELLEGQVLSSNVNLEREIPCAFSSDLISDILMCTKEATLLLTGLTNPQVIRLSDMIDLLGIVFVRGKIPPDELIQMAEERDLPLISTKMTMFRSSGLLYNSGLRSCKI